LLDHQPEQVVLGRQVIGIGGARGGQEGEGAVDVQFGLLVERRPPQP
jgi:hypothetical protein